MKWKNESLQATRQKAETDLNMKRETQFESLQLYSLFSIHRIDNLLSLNLLSSGGFIFVNSSCLEKKTVESLNTHSALLVDTG